MGLPPLLRWVKIERMTLFAIVQLVEGRVGKVGLPPLLKTVFSTFNLWRVGGREGGLAPLLKTLFLHGDLHL